MKKYTLHSTLLTLIVAFAISACGDDPEIPLHEVHTLAAPTKVDAETSSRLYNMATNIGDDVYYWWHPGVDILHPRFLYNLICYNLTSGNEKMVWEIAVDYPTRTSANHLEYNGYTIEFDYSLLGYEDNELQDKWNDVCQMMQRSHFVANNGSNRICFYYGGDLAILDLEEKKLSIHSAENAPEMTTYGSHFFYLNNKVYAHGHDNPIYRYENNQWTVVENHSILNELDYQGKEIAVYNNHIYVFIDSEDVNPVIEIYDENLQLKSTIECDIPAIYDYSGKSYISWDYIPGWSYSFITNGKMYMTSRDGNDFSEINLQTGKGRLLECPEETAFGDEKYFVAGNNFYYLKDSSFYKLAF
ncbi:MAG: hypothetical protein J6C87_10055 [Bacteroides sp.]|nr:hypothetical protein [Bacteroides sp.]